MEIRWTKGKGKSTLLSIFVEIRSTGFPNAALPTGSNDFQDPAGQDVIEVSRSGHKGATQRDA
jgi:hypothetical protein